MSAGIFAALGTLIALQERERSGRGQWVRTNLLSSQIMLLDYQAVRWLIDGKIPQQRGNDHPQIVPTGVYRSSDGYFTLSTVGNESFRRLCHAIEAPELAHDPRYATADLRERNRDGMNETLEQRTCRKSSAEWVGILNRAGVPAGPIYRLDEMFEDPQVRHSGIAQPLTHPRLGEIRIVGQPIEMMRTPAQFRRPPPDLGEHTSEVLAELGFDEGEIAEMKSKRVI
jgi:crotonobetainyl-CoA:carnitine CoA-transferase CaiB-like acyl-CoA transferase